MQRIIFDWKRTLYDPESHTLCEGAQELLTYLESQKIEMILVGKGQPETVQDVIHLGIARYFSKIFFVGTTKSKELFSPFISEPSLDTYVIGDRVRSEIEIGNKLGTTTVWIQSGTFATEQPESDLQKPTHTFSSLPNFLRYLQQRLNKG